MRESYFPFWLAVSLSAASLTERLSQVLEGNRYLWNDIGYNGNTRLRRRSNGSHQRKPHRQQRRTLNCRQRYAGPETAACEKHRKRRMIIQSTLSTAAKLPWNRSAPCPARCKKRFLTICEPALFMKQSLPEAEIISSFTRDLIVLKKAVRFPITPPMSFSWPGPK